MRHSLRILLLDANSIPINECEIEAAVIQMCSGE